MKGMDQVMQLYGHEWVIAAVKIELFEKLGERGPMILYCLDEFRLHSGSDFPFMKIQEEILQDIDSSFVLLHCCAGPGKTTLLICICFWVLKLHVEGKRVGVNYMSDTQDMVLDFLSQLIDGSSLQIAIWVAMRSLGVIA